MEKTAKNKANFTAETAIKWAIGIICICFLGYSLFAFEGYDDLSEALKQGGFFHWQAFLGVVLLIPLNWYLESVKWKMLLKDINPISLKKAFYSVLSGLTTGIFSPARLGEFAGRVLILDPKKRKKASTLWAIGSLAMTLAICLFGIPALFLFIKTGRKIDFLQHSSYYIGFILIAIFLLLLLYFYLPFIGNYFSKIASKTFSPAFALMKSFSLSFLFNILSISILRYFVFCFQYGLMLSFFGVELSFYETCIGIFTAYLLITFFPSVFLTEAAVKSSIFLLIFSSFSTNSVAIIGSSMLLWIINLAIPTLLGVFVLTKKRS